MNHVQYCAAWTSICCRFSRRFAKRAASRGPPNGWPHRNPRQPRREPAALRVPRRVVRASIARVMPTPAADRIYAKLRGALATIRESVVAASHSHAAGRVGITGVGWLLPLLLNDARRRPVRAARRRRVVRLRRTLRQVARAVARRHRPRPHRDRGRCARHPADSRGRARARSTCASRRTASCWRCTG